MLGAKGIPNRVDSWVDEHGHDWVTWRAMLPKYLEDFLEDAAESESEAMVEPEPGDTKEA